VILSFAVVAQLAPDADIDCGTKTAVLTDDLGRPITDDLGVPIDTSRKLLECTAKLAGHELSWKQPLPW
jgi:hypothetical protein